MSDENNPKIRAAVTEWQEKYNIKEGDPLLALVDLFRIHFGKGQSAPQSAAPYIPSFVEFRDSIELLDECSKRFSKQAPQLIEAMRGVPNIRKQIRFYHVVVLLLVGLVTGIFLGRFIF